MSSEEFALVPLHKHPELVLKCCKLLNDEWPRSETARLRSIESSNPNLPTSLILVTGPNKDQVVGHAKVTRLPKDPESCWIECVVISPRYRGKGLGRLVMDGCEQLAGEMGFSTAFLSTHDQQGFYGKLGYDFCEPICHYGSVAHRSTSSKSHSNTATNRSGFRPAIYIQGPSRQTSANLDQTVPNIPVPPPMPTSCSIKPPCAIKMYMKKSIKRTPSA